MRPTTLRDARKLGLLPSVTNVLGVINKPELVEWKMTQAVLAALTLPRRDGEDLGVFAKASRRRRAEPGEGRGGVRVGVSRRGRARRENSGGGSERSLCGVAESAPRLVPGELCSRGLD
jgi:hypothetical protein